MVECESRIEHVTVYARGALVTRRVVLPQELPEGPVELAVAGVTPLAEAGSLSAAAIGGREVISLRTRLIVPDAPATPGPLLERVRELEWERQRLAVEHTHLVARRDMLSALAIQPRWVRRARPVAPVALATDALAMSELVHAKVEALDARIAALCEAIETNAREVEAAKLAAAQGTSAQRQGAAQPALQILVGLSGAPAQQPLRSLAIEYAIGAARWWPAYKAWLSEAASRVRWELDALVAQASGEDWTAVRVSVTTADLACDARLPELRSIRLGRAQPPVRKGYRPAPAGLDQLFEGYDEAMARQRFSPPPPSRAQARSARMAPPPQARAAPPPPPPASPHVAQLVTSSLAAVDSPAAAGGPVADSQPWLDAPLAGLGAPSALQSMSAAAPPPVAAPAAYGGAPPPPPAAAPVAFGAAPPRRPAPGAAPPARGAPGKGAAQGYAASSLMEEDDRPTTPPTAPPPPAPIEPDDAWLDFDSLTLANPQDRARRGRLVREGRSAQQRAAAAARASIDNLANPPLTRDPRESRGQFDHRYEAAGTCDIPSNGRIHRIAIAGQDATASPRFRAVPRETPEVYREAHIDNPIDAPLLAGPVDVFMDGALMATSSMAAVDRGGAIRLGLGVEDRIRVARNARVEESTAGLLGGSTVIDHAVTIDLASSLGIAVTVDVIDRIAVTDDKDIAIKLVSSSPPGEAYDQAELGTPVRGALRFAAGIPAGGKAKVEFTYRVKLPAKSEIVGGNRRE